MAAQTQRRRPVAPGGQPALLAVAIPPVLAAVSVTCTLAAVWLHARNRSDADVASVLSASDVTVAVTYPLVGAFLLRRRPNNAAGWVLLSTSLIGVYVLAGQYAVRGLVIESQGLPLATAAAWLAMWGWAPHLTIPTLLPLLFPDGPPPDRRSRRLLATAFILIAVAVGCRVLATGSTDVSPRIENPTGLAAAFNIPAAIAAMSIFLVVAPLVVVSLVRRQRLARGRERAQLQWLMVGGIAALAGILMQPPLPEPWGDAAFTVGLLGIPVAIVVAVVRHRALDIEVVLNRALVYGLLSALLLAAYAGTVVLVGQLAFGRGVALAVVGLSAIASAAVFDRVKQLVDRLLYGERRNPYAVVTRLAGRLDVAAGPLDALHALLVELRSVLKLPYVVAVPDHSDLVPVADGEPVATLERLALTAQGREVGTLAVGHRNAGERFRPEERSVLVDVARRAGALVQAAGLVADLQRTRERLVSAREEERRRLRADLHDGLGPQLAAIALQLDSLVEDVAPDPVLASRVERLRDRTRETVAEVRKIVDDLRPPALDQLGLAGALRQHAAGLSDAGLTVEVVTPPALPAMPAAVEVAAYRIATEAVTNAVRHAGCTTCCVDVAADDGWLVMHVDDDGRGFSPEARPGVGLRSMRDRAEELGGTFEVVAGPGPGTVVRARLPLEGG